MNLRSSERRTGHSGTLMIAASSSSTTTYSTMGKKSVLNGFWIGIYA